MLLNCLNTWFKFHKNQQQSCQTQLCVDKKFRCSCFYSKKSVKNPLNKEDL